MLTGLLKKDLFRHLRSRGKFSQHNELDQAPGFVLEKNITLENGTKIFWPQIPKIWLQKSKMQSSLHALSWSNSSRNLWRNQTSSFSTFTQGMTACQVEGAFTQRTTNVFFDVCTAAYLSQNKYMKAQRKHEDSNAVGAVCFTTAFTSWPRKNIVDCAHNLTGDECGSCWQEEALKTVENSPHSTIKLVLFTIKNILTCSQFFFVSLTTCILYR